MIVRTYRVRFEFVGAPTDDVEYMLTTMFGLKLDNKCDIMVLRPKGAVLECIREIPDTQLPSDLHNRIIRKIRKFHEGAKLKSTWTLISSTSPVFADVKPSVFGDVF